ncbi:MAG: RNA pseudouridine synthase [Verrucomicrobiota bacterium]|nr:MAG: RNA pseudouridine synthase [Verrucomicrobiota bacterium]
MAPGVHVVAVDPNGVVALYKPCGIMSIPNRPGHCRRALLSLGYDPVQRCYQNNREKFFLLNRLDTPTSGIVLGCTSLSVTKAIRQAFAAGCVQKEYRALVQYQSLPQKGIFRDVLQKQRLKDCVRSCRVEPKLHSQGTLAITRYMLIRTVSLGSEMPTLAIYQLQPVTGRTHQLRVQCALRQMPIVGDQTYGDFKLNRQLVPILGKRLYLQSCAIDLEYCYQGQSFQFSAQVPYEF